MPCLIYKLLLASQNAITFDSSRVVRLAGRSLRMGFPLRFKLSTGGSGTPLGILFYRNEVCQARMVSENWTALLVESLFCPGGRQEGLNRVIPSFYRFPALGPVALPIVCLLRYPLIPSEHGDGPEEVSVVYMTFWEHFVKHGKIFFTHFAICIPVIAANEVGSLVESHISSTVFSDNQLGYVLINRGT